MFGQKKNFVELLRPFVSVYAIFIPFFAVLGALKIKLRDAAGF
jgi:hypothetical protein